MVIYNITVALLTNTGYLNGVLTRLGLPGQNWMMKASGFLPLIAVTNLWKELGWGTIIYMAALTSIDTSLFEVAKIDGAGRVRLVLTWADAGESVYQQNTRTSGSGENASAESTVAAVPSGSSAQQALVAKQLAPKCAGALIVSDGGGNAAVRLALCDAVRALTGLRADQITVVKMKST